MLFGFLYTLSETVVFVPFLKKDKFNEEIIIKISTRKKKKKYKKENSIYINCYPKDKVDPQ